MNGTLYMLIFDSGKSYIGITTKTAQKRFRQHAADARHGSDLLVHRAWRSHGAPTLVILATLSEDDLPQTEVRAIAAFKTQSPDGYNATAGGDTSPALIPEIAAKIGRKGKIIGPEWRANLSAALKGKKRTDETRARMSASLRLRVCKLETRAKLSAILKADAVRIEMLRALAVGQRGIPRDREHRINTGLAAKRAWVTEAYRAKQTARSAAHRHTDEARAKISAANKGRKWSQESRARFSQKKSLECSTPEGRDRMKNMRIAAC